MCWASTQGVWAAIGRERAGERGREEVEYKGTAGSGVQARAQGRERDSGMSGQGERAAFAGQGGARGGCSGASERDLAG